MRVRCRDILIVLFTWLPFSRTYDLPLILWHVKFSWHSALSQRFFPQAVLHLHTTSTTQYQQTTHDVVFTHTINAKKTWSSDRNSPSADTDWITAVITTVPTLITTRHLSVQRIFSYTLSIVTSQSPIIRLLIHTTDHRCSTTHAIQVPTARITHSLEWDTGLHLGITCVTKIINSRMTE